MPFGGAVSGKEQEGASEDPVSVPCLGAGCMVCWGKLLFLCELYINQEIKNTWMHTIQHRKKCSLKKKLECTQEHEGVEVEILEGGKV